MTECNFDTNPPKQEAVDVEGLINKLKEMPDKRQCKAGKIVCHNVCEEIINYLKNREPRADLQGQINKLADFIISLDCGHPRHSEGAVDTAIRMIKEIKNKDHLLEMMAEALKTCEWIRDENGHDWPRYDEEKVSQALKEYKRLLRHRTKRQNS